MPKLFEQTTLQEFMDAKGITALLEKEFTVQNPKRKPAGDCRPQEA